MGADWLKIKNDYINGLGSAAELSKRYNVPAGTIRSRASRGGWQVEHERQRNTVAVMCNEKAAKAVAEAEADRISSLARINAKAISILEKRLDHIEEIDGRAYEVKAIMETVKIIRDLAKTDEKADDPLRDYMEAFKNA